MPTARAGLGVGVVNGVLYAVGGLGSTGYVATVEAYDSTTNTWSTKAAMPTARGGLGVGVVNGVLYAVGGECSSGALGTVEAYDPATNTWSAKAAMPSARYGPGVGVVDGVLYAVGGWDASGALATVEAYDPATNTWSTKAAMPTARNYLGVGVVNGVLYAVGGWSGSGYVPTVDAYNPATNTWRTMAAMQIGRYGLGVGVVDGVLYAVGGEGNGGALATVEAYDPATNAWSTKAAMPTARGYLGVGVANGVLYAVGGSGSRGATVEAYDPATNTWSTKTMYNPSSMPTARYGLGVGVVDGVLYAVGGWGASGALATVEAYDPATNIWSTKAAMPTARGRLGVGVVNGVLYAVGGYSDGWWNPLATVEAYDPATNTWSTKAAMPTARGYLGVGVVNGVLYAVGGFNYGHSRGTMEAYGPTTNSWSTKAAMPTARYGLGVGVVNGVLYAVGGASDLGALALVEAYAASNSAPTASGVSISGTLAVGQVLTGHYTYGDIDGDAEGTSAFRWLRDGVAIASATALTHTAVIADSGPAITFEVTPKAATGATPGVAVTSAEVRIQGAPPTLALAPTTLRFAGKNTNGTLSQMTGAQTVTVAFNIPPALAWSASANQPWVQITNGSGTGNGAFSVSIINPGDVLGAATSGSAVVTVTAAGASNSPQTIAVLLTLQSPAEVDRWARLTPTARAYLGVGVANGVLYAVGGWNGSNYLGTVEAYDPATNTWSTKATMPTARNAFAVGVVSGVLYAVGGYNGNHGWLETVEAYDPATNTWSTKAAMPTARRGLGVAVVNGVLYAVGGLGRYDGLLATVEAYDPATNTWSTKAAMPTARSYFGVGVVNGVLYAVGGNGNAFGSVFLATVEAYDPATNTWSTRAAAPTARRGLGVGVVNGVLYAVGGYRYCGSSDDHLATVEAYDPATSIWIQKAMPTARRYVGVGVVNGVVYVLGGWGNDNRDLATVEAYDPATNTWSTKAAMPTARSWFGVGVVDGVLYAVGGKGPGYVLATVEAYDPATDTWRTMAAMPTARAYLGVGVVNGVLYAVGGQEYYGQLATVEAYDPATNTWSTKAAMPTARSYFGVGVVNGVLYAVGGGNGSNYLGTVEAYDPAINFWSTKAPMPTARLELGVGVVNGVLYAVGGRGYNGIQATVETYTAWNSAPMATAVSITGTSAVGWVLTGHYAYGDADGDAEGTSTFRWLRGGAAIGGATALTYTTVAADNGQTLTFEVTPKAATGATPGVAVTSPGVIILSVASALALTPTALRYAGTNTDGTLSPITGAQTATVTVADGAPVAWTASANRPWVQITNGSGTGSGTFTIGIINPGNVLGTASSVSALVTVTANGASNSPQTIAVELTLRQAAANQAPFGAFDTPVDGTTGMQGSFAVTGWALDDVGIDHVELWRDLAPSEEPSHAYTTDPSHPAYGKVYIANPLFVVGSRTDIEGLYGTYPFANRAGWGYLLLSWGLHGQGNGTYKLYAYAYDVEGHSALLGSKSITVDNAHATKPFGAIDTPAYGGTMSGAGWNFGWALTPNATPACTITNGSVTMHIDSGPAYVVNYGDPRSDIAASFAGFSNGTNSGGASYLDTTTLSNGTHQIGWLVYDNCGRGDGIGSRFFTVLNGTTDVGASRPEAGLELGDPRLAAAPHSVEPGTIQQEPLAGLNSTSRRSPSADLRAGVPLGSRGSSPARQRRSARGDESPSTGPVSVRHMGGDWQEVPPDIDGWHVIEVPQAGRIEVQLPLLAAGIYETFHEVIGERRPLPLGSSFDAKAGIFYWQPAPAFLGGFDLVFEVPDGDSVRVRVRVK